MGLRMRKEGAYHTPGACLCVEGRKEESPSPIAQPWETGPSVDTPSSQILGATFSCQTAFCFLGEQGGCPKEILDQIWVQQNHLGVTSFIPLSLASRPIPI